MLLEVSVEMVDNGRGMNSIVSEKPTLATRGRLGAGALSRRSIDIVVRWPDDGRSDCGTNLSVSCGKPDRLLGFEGVDGALPALVVGLSLDGFKIIERS